MSWHELYVIAIALVVAFVLLVVALVSHLAYWDRKLGVKMHYALELRLPTPDGAAIELRRLPPRERIVSAADHEPAPGSALEQSPGPEPPILLVHGLGANHRNHDLLPDHSLARYLSALGRDVWLVTLRSGVERLPRRALRHVRFGAMVEHDLPLAVDEVLRRTEHARLDYVGFSMGGMLLYAALGHTLPESKLRRAVIIGSPAVIKTPFQLPRFIARLPEAIVPTARLRLFGRIWAFAVEWIRTPFHHLVANPDNIAPGLGRHALVNLAADIAGGLHLDFVAWAVSADGVLRLNGQSVLSRLEGVQIPALFIAGSADRLAPPSAVRAAYEAWGSTSDGLDKRFVLLGREHGAKSDYGHGDLAIGRHVHEEVFAPVAAFLA